MRDRISGLYDELRPGRPRTADDERVAELIDKTLDTKPADGAKHWSTRGLAGETFISNDNESSKPLTWTAHRRLGPIKTRPLVRAN